VRTEIGILMQLRRLLEPFANLTGDQACPYEFPMKLRGYIPIA
jgi:hypothetical protein